MTGMCHQVPHPYALPEPFWSKVFVSSHDNEQRTCTENRESSAAAWAQLRCTGEVYVVHMPTTTTEDSGIANPSGHTLALTSIHVRSPSAGRHACSTCVMTAQKPLVVPLPHPTQACRHSHNHTGLAVRPCSSSHMRTPRVLDSWRESCRPQHTCHCVASLQSRHPPTCKSSATSSLRSCCCPRPT